MTTVRFLNRLHDIEGNVVEIHTKTSRVIVDFGMVGGFKEDKVKSLLASRILPDVQDLFTKKKAKFQHQAIVLSHIDVDNLNAAVYLKSDIEIYVSELGFKLYSAMVENNLIQPIYANIQPMPDALIIGDIHVEGFASDSDILGSQALMISDNKRSFGISGDVRLNGPHKHDVKKWINVFTKQKLDLFIFDATSYSFTKDCKLFNICEADLQTQFSDILEQRHDLVIINCDAFNVERLVAFFCKCQYLERTLVFEESFANIVSTFYPELKLTVLKESITNKKTTRKKFGVVSLVDIKNNPKKYVLQNSVGNISHLKKLPSGLYLHSNGCPKVSDDRDFISLREELKEIKFQYIDFSASGHASKQDLRFLVEEIKAHKTAPWHCYHPEFAIKKLQDLPTKLILPDPDKNYGLNDHSWIGR